MTRKRAIPRAVAPPAGPGRQVWALGAGLMLAVLAVYSNSVSNPFLLDDLTAITNNSQIRQLSTALSPPDETPVANRPLVNLTFAVNYALGGLDVRGYRLGNLVIHLLAALVLLALVRHTLMLPRLRARFGVHATAIASACALIWALHPLHTEIINYVTQRTAALMGLCYLLTLYCSLRGAAVSGARWRLAAVAACAAGMASKETMVTAPVLVVLFDRVFLFTGLREACRARVSLYVGLASTWVVLAALMLSGGRTTVGFGAGTSAWVYLLNQLKLVPRYLGLAFWPQALVVDYGVPSLVELGDVGWQAALVSGLAAAALLALWRRPSAGFLGVAFFILLSPTSSIVPIASEVGAERRMYLPLAALVVLLACLSYRVGQWALSWSHRRLGWEVGRRALYACCAVVFVVCALLGSRVLSRNHEYHTALSLAGVGVERWPHGRSYFAMGNALQEVGRDNEALAYFRRSVSEFPAAHFALGTMLIATDRVAGVTELRAFTRAMPHHPFALGARQLIGIAEFEAKHYERAAEELRLVVEAAPQNLAVRAMFGEALLRSGRAEDAVRQLGMVVERMPRNASAHNLLGAALAEIGRLDEAVVHFEEAVRLDPNNHEAANNLKHAGELASWRHARRMPG